MTRPPIDERHLAANVRAEASGRDRAHKIWLLVVSLAVLAVLVVAALKENVYPDWRMHQLEYAGLLRDKADDDWGRKLAADFQIQMRQVVVPAIDTTDRCVTCHVGIDDPRMTDVPSPYTVHPGEMLRWHDVNRFGCTICHRGQGRALVFAEAKAVGLHWDYPMLPLNLTQSACGVCHGASEVAARGGEKYALGEALFGQKGCLGCHRLKGRGGNTGPALDGEGMKVPAALVATGLDGPRTLPQWLTEHFADPQRVVLGSQMQPPQLSDEENEALTIYMLSLQQRDLPESYLSPGRHLAAYKSAMPDPESGPELFTRYCSVCHDTGAYGRYDKFFAEFFPAVRGSSLVQIADDRYLEENIRKGRPGRLMPPWDQPSGGLTDSDIAKLIEFLRSGDADLPSRLSPENVAWARDRTVTIQGDVVAGGTLFARHCVGCHGTAGSGLLAPALANPVFQKTVWDRFLYATIAWGRQDTAMPAFLGPGDGGFAPAQVEALVAYVRTLGKPLSTNQGETAQ